MLEGQEIGGCTGVGWRHDIINSSPRLTLVCIMRLGYRPRRVRLGGRVMYKELSSIAEQKLIHDRIVHISVCEMQTIFSSNIRPFRCEKGMK